MYRDKKDNQRLAFPRVQPSNRRMIATPFLVQVVYNDWRNIVQNAKGLNIKFLLKAVPYKIINERSIPQC
jgi:hypothetical protein